MDSTRYSRAKETLKKQNTRSGNLKDCKAHARSTEAESSRAWTSSGPSPLGERQLIFVTQLKHVFRRLTFLLPLSYIASAPPAGAFSIGASMAFRLVHAQYERSSQRAYVELGEQDADGGELIVAAIFTYRRTNSISQRALEQDLATKARHMMKRASVGLDGR